MGILTKKRCLVLNKGWTPVGTVTLERAIIMLFSTYSDNVPKARIIDHESYATMTWADWALLEPLATDEVIRGANVVFKIPEVILLSRYDKLPQPKVHFSRRNLFKRDGQVCQYCCKKFASNELTIDHVLPRAQGGVTSWENCTLACVDCNSRKANRTPEQARMTLRKKPKKPHMQLIRYDGMKPVQSWCAFLGEAYWTVDISEPSQD